MAAETLRDLVVSLSIDSTQFTRNLKSIDKQIREFESEFKLAGAGVKDFEKTTNGMKSKKSYLTERLQAERMAVGEWEKSLKHSQSAVTTTEGNLAKYTSRLDEAQKKLRLMEQRQEQLNEAARNSLGTGEENEAVAFGAAEAYTEEVKKQAKEVNKLEGQVASLKKQLHKNKDEVTDNKKALNNAKGAIAETEAEIKKLNLEIAKAESAWTKAGNGLKTFSDKMKKFGDTTTKIGKTMTASITTPIVALGKSAIDASISYESAFAGVRKTVDATEREYAQLSQTILDMSEEIAATPEEIAQVAATAGQLGIAKDVIGEFTRTMIDLGNSAEDLDANTAATTLAKFANVIQMEQTTENYRRLGSTITDLGNNYATTEGSIAEMAMRLAGAAKQVGMSESQVLGFAAALSSVGIEAQMGGSALSKALRKMETAVETGGQSLKDFAKVSGMSEDEFKKTWQEDASLAFMSFIEGLAQMSDEGISTIVTLDDLGISELRLTDTLLRTVNAHDLFTSALDTANNAWQENTALTIEANKRYATTESKLKNLKNKATNYMRVLGDDMNPTIMDLIDNAGNWIDSLDKMSLSERKNMLDKLKWAAVSGPILLAIGKISQGLSGLTGKMSSVFKYLGEFSAKAKVAGGGIKGFATALSGSPAMVFALTAAVAAGAYALIDYASGARAARQAISDMQTKAEEWKRTQADTMFQKEGLSFFNMDAASFMQTADDANKWLEGVKDEWTDGVRESDADVKEWTDGFTNMTEKTRKGLEGLYESSDDSMKDSIDSDIETLAEMDDAVAKMLKDRAGKNLTDSDLKVLQEYLDKIDEINERYGVGASGYEGLSENIEAEIARINAVYAKEDKKRQKEMTKLYEHGLVAAAEGYAEVNSQLDDDYVNQYKTIKNTVKEEEQEAALAELNAEYAAKKAQAAREYAQYMATSYNQTFGEERIEDTQSAIDELTESLAEYANTGDKSLLTKISEITDGLDEGALSDYVTMLETIEDLKNNGVTDDELAELFPQFVDEEGNIDTGIDKIKQIIETLNDLDKDKNLDGLRGMFDALSEEVAEITVRLNLEQATSEWDDWAHMRSINGSLKLTGFDRSNEDFLRQHNVNIEAGVQFKASTDELDHLYDDAYIVKNGVLVDMKLEPDKTVEEALLEGNSTLYTDDNGQMWVTVHVDYELGDIKDAMTEEGLAQSPQGGGFKDMNDYNKIKAMAQVAQNVKNALNTPLIGRMLATNTGAGLINSILALDDTDISNMEEFVDLVSNEIDSGNWEDLDDETKEMYKNLLLIQEVYQEVFGTNASNEKLKRIGINLFSDEDVEAYKEMFNEFGELKTEFYNSGSASGGAYVDAFSEELLAGKTAAAEAGKNNALAYVNAWNEYAQINAPTYSNAVNQTASGGGASGGGGSRGIGVQNNSSTYNNSNTVVVQNMTVRNDGDIQNIANELFRLTQRKQTARGQKKK